jgi:hypothetical protein
LAPFVIILAESLETFRLEYCRSTLSECNIFVCCRPIVKDLSHYQEREVGKFFRISILVLLAKKEWKKDGYGECDPPFHGFSVENLLSINYGQVVLFVQFFELVVWNGNVAFDSVVIIVIIINFKVQFIYTYIHIYICIYLKVDLLPLPALFRLFLFA